MPIAISAAAPEAATFQDNLCVSSPNVNKSFSWQTGAFTYVRATDISDMAVRKISEYPEAVLAQVGKPVTEFDDALAELCSDMYDTMYDAEGVGLAAPQIGLNLRLFVMDCDGIKLIAANPEIIHTEGEQSGSEGCLSVGKVPAVVTRPMKARLKAQDVNGKWFEHEAEGYAARAFLHETDHCDGRLFIDHLPKLRRDMVVKRFKKEKNWK